MTNMEILSQGLKRHIFINASMYKAFCFILGDKLCNQVQSGCFLGRWPCWDEHASGRHDPLHQYGTRIRSVHKPPHKRERSFCLLLLIWSRRLISTAGSARGAVRAITKGSFQPEQITRGGGQSYLTPESTTMKPSVCATPSFQPCCLHVSESLWVVPLSFCLFFFFLVWILIAKSC